MERDDDSVDPAIAFQIASELWEVAGRAMIRGRWIKITHRPYVVYLYEDGTLEECLVQPDEAADFWGGTWRARRLLKPRISKLETPEFNGIDFEIVVGEYVSILHLEGPDELHGAESRNGVPHGEQLWFRLAESDNITGDNDANQE